MQLDSERTLSWQQRRSWLAAVVSHWAQWSSFSTTGSRGQSRRLDMAHEQRQRRAHTASSTPSIAVAASRARVERSSTGGVMSAAIMSSSRSAGSAAIAMAMLHTTCGGGGSACGRPCNDDSECRRAAAPCVVLLCRSVGGSVHAQSASARETRSKRVRNALPTRRQSIRRRFSRAAVALVGCAAPMRCAELTRSCTCFAVRTSARAEALWIDCAGSLAWSIRG
jgi:hypothetical protein